MNWALIFIFCLVSSANVSAQSRRSSQPSQQNTGGGSSGSFTGTMFDTHLFYGLSKAVGKPVALTSDPTQSNEFDNTATLYAVKLGRVFSGGWYIGALYSDRSDTNGAITVKGNGVGAGLGFFANNGFNFRAFYKFNEVYGDYKNGEGFSGELSYFVKVSSSFCFGFAITHQQVTYSKNPTIFNLKPWTSSWTLPAISFAYIMR